MKRAAAFLCAALSIVLLAIVLTGGRHMIFAGVSAIIGGLAFAAFPVEGMSIVGLVACIPIVIAQAVVGAPSAAVWIIVCGLAVFVPPAAGLLLFIVCRQQFDDTVAIVTLICFIAAWLAVRRIHKQLVIGAERTISRILKPINSPIEEARQNTFKYFEDAGKWMTT